MTRRREIIRALGGLALGACLPPVAALQVDRPTQAAAPRLNGEQSDHFRAWMGLIVADQIRRGPSPRWYHRDCAGLARFAVAEAFRPHDEGWRRANGFLGRRLPPDMQLRPDQSALRSGWKTIDGDRQAFATALALIQNNSHRLGPDSALARPGDLLFFDQGDDQHLMIWMGNWIAYHTGQTPPPPAPDRRGIAHRKTLPSPEDNGLRTVTLAQLLQWKDTRWRPRDDNPNFSGFYRLAFLSR